MLVLPLEMFPGTTELAIRPTDEYIYECSKSNATLDQKNLPGKSGERLSDDYQPNCGRKYADVKT